MAQPTNPICAIYRRQVQCKSVQITGRAHNRRGIRIYMQVYSIYKLYMLHTSYVPILTFGSMTKHTRFIHRVHFTCKKIRPNFLIFSQQPQQPFLIVRLCLVLMSYSQNTLKGLNNVLSIQPLSFLCKCSFSLPLRVS